MVAASGARVGTRHGPCPVASYGPWDPSKDERCRRLKYPSVIQGFLPVPIREGFTEEVYRAHKPSSVGTVIDRVTQWGRGRSRRKLIKLERTGPSLARSFPRLGKGPTSSFTWSCICMCTLDVSTTVDQEHRLCPHRLLPVSVGAGVAASVLGMQLRGGFMGVGVRFSLVGFTCVLCSHVSVVMVQQRLGAPEETSPTRSGNPKRLFIMHRCWPSGVASKG